MLAISRAMFKLCTASLFGIQNLYAQACGLIKNQAIFVAATIWGFQIHRSASALAEVRRAAMLPLLLRRGWDNRDPSACRQTQAVWIQKIWIRISLVDRILSSRTSPRSESGQYAKLFGTNTFILLVCNFNQGYYFPGYCYYYLRCIRMSGILVLEFCHLLQNCRAVHY